MPKVDLDRMPVKTLSAHVKSVSMCIESRFIETGFVTATVESWFGFPFPVRFEVTAFRIPTTDRRGYGELRFQ